MIKAIQAHSFFRKGQQLARKGDFSGSLRNYDKAIEIDPKNGQIFLHKALALSKLNRYEAALQWLKSAIDRDAGNPAYYLFSGVIHYDHQMVDEAAICFDKALALAPSNILAVCYRCLVRLKKNERQSESLDTLVKQIQNTNAEFKARFLVLCESELYQYKPRSRSLEQTKFFDTYLNPDHKASPSLTDRIFALSNSILLHLSFLFHPDKKQAYRELARASNALNTGDIDAAQKPLQNALDSSIDFSEALDLLSDICIYRNDFKLLFEYLEKVDAFQPIFEYFSKSANPRNGATDEADEKNLDLSSALYLGVLYTHKGEFDRAIELLKRCASDRIKSYYPFYYLGLCYVYTHDDQTAFDCFLQAMNRLNQDLLTNRILEYKRIVSATA